MNSLRERQIGKHFQIPLALKKVAGLNIKPQEIQRDYRDMQLCRN